MDKLGPTSLLLRVVANPDYPPPMVEPAKLPVAVVGHEYHVAVPVQGGRPPVKFDFNGTAPPPGLSWSESGQITGKPLKQGTWRVPVTIQDSLGQMAAANGPREFELLVLEPPPPPLKIESDSLPHAVLGVPYQAALLAHGGWPPYQWAVSGALPAWAAVQRRTLLGNAQSYQRAGRDRHRRQCRRRTRPHSRPPLH